MEAIAEALGFDVNKFIWALINFLILVFLLKKFAYKPVLNMLDERKRSIEESLTRAEKARDEAERMQKEYEAQLAQAREEAQRIIEQATKLGEQMKEEILANAQAEASKAIQRAQEEIAREREKAVVALREEVANLAVLAAGKVLGRAISVEDHEKMIKEFIAEVGDLQ
ncbi:MAG: F-type H+-transporting ATPase subunit b [Eubacteriales bacterium]|nr:F-type H+-transporting ATPase subunit b [Eubacteriales bacterium]